MFALAKSLATELTSRVMSQAVCISCRRPKATTDCQNCNEPLCRDCIQATEDSTFAFLTVTPKELSHRRYCTACYTNFVEPALESYNETLERARVAFVFFAKSNSRIPVLKRSKTSVRVAHCIDRDETILRLGFQAAQEGYNAITETVVEAKKVRNEGYQTSSWSGTAVPVTVDAAKLEREEKRETF